MKSGVVEVIASNKRACCSSLWMEVGEEGGLAVLVAKAKISDMPLNDDTAGARDVVFSGSGIQDAIERSKHLDRGASPITARRASNSFHS